MLLNALPLLAPAILIAAAFAPRLASRHELDGMYDQLKDILVVEDSLSARKSLKLLLEDAGYHVRTAVDGLQAVNAINERTPDAVLTDLEMPNMNGLDLTSHIRADVKHRELAEKAGVNTYLTKPYSDSEVLGTIKGVISPEPVEN